MKEILAELDEIAKNKLEEIKSRQGGRKTLASINGDMMEEAIDKARLKQPNGVFFSEMQFLEEEEEDESDSESAHLKKHAGLEKSKALQRMKDMQC